MSTVSCVDDPRFISAFKAGKEVAFDQLFREFFLPLSLFAYQYTKDRATAEDIVQECFLYLWEHRKQFGKVSAIKAYLYTVVRNKVFKKGQQPFNPIQQVEEADHNKNMEEALISAETARELYLHIASLPPRVQEVIRLSFLEEKSNQEISHLLDISTDTVTRQKLRGIIALRATKHLL